MVIWVHREDSMSSADKRLYGGFTLLTALLVEFNGLFGSSDATKFCMFAIRAILFITVLRLPKKFGEQRLLVWAFGLTLVSDFFFVLMKMNIFNWSSPILDILGIGGFIGAYLVLILTFAKNFRLRKPDILVGTPYLICFGLVFRVLSRYVSGMMLMAPIVLGVVLCVTAVVMAGTLYREYFGRRSAVLIALSGTVLFFSDMLVAFSMFHPDYQSFILWHQNAIWITYMVG